MKVLLLKDIYKLGRAGDVKKVADGYGRNFLLPQGLAVLATEGALKQSEKLRSRAAEQRNRLNEEMGGLADKLNALTLTFAVKAGETGKLYGSITTTQIAQAIKDAIGEEIDRRHVGHQPLRELGTYKIPVRLTVDLIPNVTVIVHREGESVTPQPEVKPAAAEAPVAAEPAEEPAVESAEAPGE